MSIKNEFDAFFILISFLDSMAGGDKAPGQYRSLFYPTLWLQWHGQCSPSTNNIKVSMKCIVIQVSFRKYTSSVTRSSDFLDFGQLFKVFGNN